MVTYVFPQTQAINPLLAMAGALVPYGMVLWLLTLILIAISAQRAWRLLGLIPIAALCVQLLWVQGYLPGTAPQGTAPGLRIASVNTLYGKADPASIAAGLAETRADIIVLQEASQPLAESAELAEVLDDYPYREGRLAPGYSNIGYEDSSATYIASKRPLTLMESLDTTHEQYLLRTTTRADVPVTVLVAHTTNMLGGTKRWVDEAHLLADAVERHTDEPLLIIGDLNATPENLAYRIITDAGVSSAASQAGHGWAPTYRPAPGLPALIAIDHALINERLMAYRYATFPVTGSDHRGIVVDIAVR